MKELEGLMERIAAVETVDDTYTGKTHPQLLLIRDRLDRIDNTLLDLLMERTKIIEEAGQLKRTYMNEDDCYITSAREADMVKTLAYKVHGSFPKEAVVNIWRNIIAASCSVEVPLSLSVYHPDNDLKCLVEARNYFGTFSHSSMRRNVRSVIEDVETNRAVIGVLPLVYNEQFKWWSYLAEKNSDLRVFACLPFVTNRNCLEDTNIVAIARIANEKSKEDKSLMTLEVSNRISSDQIIFELSDMGFVMKLLANKVLPSKKNVYLIEFDGYLSANDQSMVRSHLQKSFEAKVFGLGNYATPVTV
jgi:chorismate mutase / prephenate dehydratase